ncbi:VCBS domain-containing protein [Roseibium suaedae]|uniref:VCBS domain-containing protein n=1 Tax=Roseibium suaedae TaxID=735517 RepID=UPI000ADDD0AB|nr:VCBS domain-containing protein [Roseibium suaedae]
MITDPDPGQAHFTAVTGAAGKGAFGQFELRPDGQWTYTADNGQTAVQALKSGEALTDRIVIYAADGTSHELRVVISGTNDRPVLSAATASATEDGKAISGQMQATDVDTCDTKAFSIGQPIEGFSLHPDGSWSFDPSHAAYQHLAAGLTQQVIIPVTVTDSAGATDTQNLVITVTGTNDGARIGGTPVGTVTEDKLLTTGGKLDVTDPDAGQAQFVPQTGVAGAHGLFTVHPDGTWSYQLDNSQPAVQALTSGGGQLTDTLTVSTLDGTTQQITVTINGTDDGAKIGGTAVGTVTEDRLLTTGGKLDVTDPDAGQAQFVPQTGVAGAHGLFTVHPDGTWSYQLDNSQPAVQALTSGGGQLTDTLTVSTLDGTTQQITVTINGTDDGAKIGGTAVGTVTEDKLLTTGGKLDVTDPDAGQAQFVPQTGVAGAHGLFTVHPDGTWSYQLDNSQPAVQALTSGGGQLTDTLTVSTLDGTTTTITVQIGGTNDKPVLTAASASATEDGKSVSGQMQASDVDTGDTRVFTMGQPVDGFTLHPDGSWSFDPGHAAYQHLAAAQTEQVTIPVTVTDSAGATDTQNLVITVTGTNDVPVVAGPVSLGSGKEDQSVAITLPQLLAHVTDIDTGDSLSVTGLTASHGTITGDAAHGFTFTPDANYNGPVSLSYQVTDGHGGSVLQSASLTLVPVSDPAVIGGQDKGDVTEDHITGMYALSANGKLTISDPDAGEDKFVSYTPYQMAYPTALGGNSRLTIYPWGTWHYDGDNNLPQVQALKAGETLIDTVTVRSVDGTTHTIEITIHGTNDRPVLTAATASATEDGATVTGQMHATDVDTGDTKAFSTGQPVDGFTMHADGSWSFDPSHAAYQHLAAGQTEQVTIPVTVTDSAGAKDTQDLVITVTGTNDGPVVSGPVTLPGGTEDHAVSITAAQLLAHATDIDTGDVLSVSGVSASHGTITGDAAHGFTFTPDANYNGPVTLSYQVTDGQGGSVQQTASLVLGATPDAAVITGTDTGDVTEDRNVGPSSAHPLAISGSLSVHDPDGPSQEFFQFNRFGEHAISDPFGGSLHINRVGTWGYEVDNTHPAVQALAAGQEGHAIYEVHSADGTAHRIQITVHGTNDAPVLTAATASATEDGSSVTGQMAATDVDTGDTKAFSIGQPVDGFTMHSDGSWSFDPSHAAYQHLAAGQTQQVTIPVTVTDSAGATDTENLVITVTGTNDGARIGGTVVGTVTEDTLLNTGGKLDVTDPDAGQAQFVPQPHAVGAHGTFTVQPDGTWSYQLDNSQPAVQALQAGGTPLTDTLTVASVDGTTHDITVTITGTNDAPVLTAATASATEDGSAVTGRMSATDVDTGDTKAFSIGQPVDGFIMHADGSWSFDPSHAAYQHLAAGQTEQVTIPVTVTDSAGAMDTQNLVITVTGTGDAAVIGGIDTGSVTENMAGQDKSPDYAQPGISKLWHQTIQATGTLTITDPDSGEASFDTHGLGWTYHGQFGDLMLRENGEWFYNADVGSVRSVGGYATTRGTTIDRLGEGQNLTDTITVYSKDGTAHDIVITIHGSNDRPYCSSEVQLAGGTEDVAQTLTLKQLLANTVDVDANDAGKLTVVALKVDHGSIRDNQDGTYTYTPEKDYNGQVHFTYDVQDTHGGVTHTGATTTLAAVNDAAVIAGTDAGGATEDSHVDASGHLTATGKLDVTDPDAGEAGFTPVSGASGAGTYGTFTLDAQGHWMYTADNSQAAVQALLAGGTPLTDTLTVASADGTTHDITVTITGTNDAPVLTAATASATEDGSAVTGQMSATDVDTGDTKAFSIGQPVHGFTMHADGSWSFDPSHAAYQHLAASQTQQVTILVRVTDSAGATDTENLVITVTGTNDVPVVSGPVNLGSGTEDKAVPITAAQLLAHATDIDTGDVLSVTGLTASHGTITGDAAHGFTFTPDANYNGPVSLSYQVTDGHGGSVQQTASLVLGATPDAAVITGTDTGDVTEDQHLTGGLLTANGTLTIADPDVGEAAFTPVSGVAGAGTYGTFTLDAQGHWTYTADNSQAAVQALQAGGTPLTDTLTVASVDGTTHDITVSIHGTNDAPVLTAATASATEDGASVTGRMSATDVDTGDNKAFSIGQPVDGFTMHADGSWSFDPSHAAYQHLAAGQTQQVTIPVTVTDGAGATDTQDLVITVTGTYDPPPVKPTVGTVQGVGSQHLTGTITSGITGGWAIDNGHGGAVQSLHGQYGTLVIDPQTGHFEYHYQQNSGVIKQGGSSGTSGQHVDTFHIVQQGIAAGDADVQVQIDVQSVHGSSGHHVDHTTLQGITFTPSSGVQHDAPDDAGPDDITIDLTGIGAAPPVDHDTATQELISGALDTDHAGIPSHDGEAGDVSQAMPAATGPDATGGGRLAAYFDAIGQGHDASPPPAPRAGHMSAYLDAAGADPALTAHPADLPDPAVLDADHPADTIEGGPHGTADADNTDVPAVPDLPDSPLPDPNDDTSQFG